MKIAIMQPYFFPYEGYFRLFTKTDLFVIYDCVQFPRRGWVHRNKFINLSGNLEWLTLPIKKVSRDVKIRDLEFQDDSQEIWMERIGQFPLLKEHLQDNKDLHEVVTNLDCSVIDYLINNLAYVCKERGVHFNIVRSSELKIDESLKGQDRIIEIAKRIGAIEYINLPGGKLLYDQNKFLEEGITLSFLDNEDCKKNSMLELIINKKC
ncbi:MAG: hypothetical protein ACJAW3_000956 [Lentimonas sp.]|jgi:hypothetical protein